MTFSKKMNPLRKFVNYLLFLLVFSFSYLFLIFIFMFIALISGGGWGFDGVGPGTIQEKIFFHLSQFLIGALIFPALIIEYFFLNKGDLSKHLSSIPVSMPFYGIASLVVFEKLRIRKNSKVE